MEMNYGSEGGEFGEAGRSSIDKVDEMSLNKEEVCVDRSLTRSKRRRHRHRKPAREQLRDQADEFANNNYYVKNSEEALDDQKFRERFGSATRSTDIVNDENQSRELAVVRDEHREDAKKAVEGLNGKHVDGRTLHVGRVRTRKKRASKMKEEVENRKQETNSQGQENHKVGKKAVEVLNGKDVDGRTLNVQTRVEERVSEMKKKSEKLMQEENSLNRERAKLYVDNLGKRIDDDALFSEFAHLETVENARVALRKDGRSKRFGFISFSSPEEATKAVADMNGKFVFGKPMYVALAWSESERRAEQVRWYERLSASNQGKGLPPNGLPSAIPRQPVTRLPAVGSKQKYLDCFMTKMESGCYYGQFGDQAEKFTNIYFKYVGDALDDTKLREIFEAFGPITSCKVMVNIPDQSRGFGFVSYEDRVDADEAVGRLNGTYVGGRTILFVGRAQKRVSEMKENSETRKERVSGVRKKI